MPTHFRPSFESIRTNGSDSYSFYQPRRLESIMAEEEMRQHQQTRSSSFTSLTESSTKSLRSTMEGTADHLAASTSSRAPSALPLSQNGSPHTLTTPPEASSHGHRTSQRSEPVEQHVGFPTQPVPPEPVVYSHSRAARSERSPLGRQSPLQNDLQATRQQDIGVSRRASQGLDHGAQSSSRRNKLQKKRRDSTEVS